MPAPLPTKLKFLILPSFNASFVHTHTLPDPQIIECACFCLNFHSAVCFAKLSPSLSDWQLNIDGLEIAEVPQMLSVFAPRPSVAYKHERATCGQVLVRNPSGNNKGKACLIGRPEAKGK